VSKTTKMTENHTQHTFCADYLRMRVEIKHDDDAPQTMFFEIFSWPRV